MDNIRVSIDLLKLQGAKVINYRDPASGQTVNAVAVPCTSLFCPEGDQPRAFMQTMLIPTPKSIYADFMAKPFVSGREFAHLSSEERNAIPAIGKATFIKAAPSREILQQAERVDVETGEIIMQYPNTNEDPI